MSAKILAFAPRARSSESLSDAALLAACATGDAPALGLLFERFAARVSRFLSRMLGSRTPEIEDLTQATFVEVWRAAPRYRGASSVQVWIFGIAHNLARHHLRGRKRQASAITAFGERPTAPEQPLDERCEQARLVERVAEGLAILSPELRGAFVLCDLEGVACVEAAEILRVPAGTVRRRLFEARQRLRALLGGTLR
ncbi:MAG: RNA polymerase sigma factor [Deltaproteobacteria bacterium]|nr:RNA polymerase sigma factor [Deltaproteobacteria bacterium]